jgi:hypothetical protein
MEFCIDRHPAASQNAVKHSRAGISMAIFHMAVKTVSRGKGQSAIAKAAYNARENIRDERTGEMKSYSRFTGDLFSGIFAPKNAPEWAKDRAALWNAVEAAEKRKDAQLSREITLGLPHELTDEQRKQLVTDFVREQFQRKGMVADVNIHAPGGKGDDRNYHAHILVTMREIGPEGFGLKVRDWNSKEQLENWREAWERTQNRYLERHGHEARVDRRTLQEQGIDRQPTIHLGPQLSAMERRTEIETERGNALRDSFSAAQESAKLKIELAQIQRQIRAIERSLEMPQGREASKPETRQRQDAARFDAAAADKRPPQSVTNNNRPLPITNVPGRAANVVGRGAFKLAEAIFSLLVPDPPKTPAQLAKIADQKERAEIDWSKYLYNTEHERAMAHQQEQIRQQEKDRENWQKQQKERERER